MPVAAEAGHPAQRPAEVQEQEQGGDSSFPSSVHLVLQVGGAVESPAQTVHPCPYSAYSSGSLETAGPTGAVSRMLGPGHRLALARTEPVVDIVVREGIAHRDADQKEALHAAEHAAAAAVRDPDRLLVLHRVRVREGRAALPIPESVRADLVQAAWVQITTRTKSVVSAPQPTEVRWAHTSKGRRTRTFTVLPLDAPRHRWRSCASVPLDSRCHPGSKGALR